MERLRPPLRCLVLDFFLQGEFSDRDRHTLWHGAFGKTLSQVSPSLFEQLYGIAENRARLYSLVPPLPGYPRLRVTLTGEACDGGLAITETVKEMGRRGLGKGCRSFSIHWAQYGAREPIPYYYGQNDETIGVPEARCITKDFFNQDMDHRNRMRFCTITPLILKEGNGLMVHPPTFSVLVRRLLGRVSQLAHAADAQLPYDEDQQHHWQRMATSVRLVDQKMRLSSFARQSKRTRHHMVFNGWEGTLEYAGPVAHFHGLFKLGEKLQLGGRTAFGFGAFQTFWGNVPELEHNLPSYTEPHNVGTGGV
jgi:hypothetical protein